MKTIHIPGSKSITNRVLLLSAIGSAPVTLKNLLESDDTVYMRNVLSSFRVEFTAEDALLSVLPPQALTSDGETHYIGNAGTVARFVSAISLIISGKYGLKGISRMHERPQADLFAALRTLGVDVTCLENDGFLPAKYVGKAGHLDQNHVVLSGHVSSQFVSALLLVAPLIKGGLTVEMESVPPSQPYIEMTLEILRLWEVDVSTSGDLRTMTVSEGLTPPKEYTIPADMSGASYPAAWATLCKKNLTIADFGQKTLQGDEGFLTICEHFGANIEKSGEDCTLNAFSEGNGTTTFDFSPMPDVAMTGMIMACFYEGDYRFIGLESLRVKECDRIQAMVDGFTQLGIQTMIEGDDVTIKGGASWQTPEKIRAIQASTIETNSHDDHRIAMCFGVLRSTLSHYTGIAETELFQIGEPHCVAKTWPNFWDDLAEWNS